jgi:hypothetical protein
MKAAYDMLFSAAVVGKIGWPGQLVTVTRALPRTGSAAAAIVSCSPKSNQLWSPKAPPTPPYKAVSGDIRCVSSGID